MRCPNGHNRCSVDDSHTNASRGKQEAPIPPARSAAPAIGVLDTLRALLGEELSIRSARRLTDDKAREIGALLKEQGTIWPAAPPLEPDELRLFVEARLDLLDPGHRRQGSDAFIGALLYGDRVVVPEPGFGPEALRSIIGLAPLIERGDLILVPDKELFSPAEAEIWEEVIQALEADGAWASFANDKPGHPESWFYIEVAAEAFTRKYWNAEAADAKVLPDDAVSRKDFAHRLRIAGEDLEEHDVDFKAVNAVATAFLPRLESPSLATVISARNELEAFEDWRAQLRNASRLISSSVVDASFESEARAVFDDTVVAQTRRLKTELSKSRTFTRVAKEESMQMAFGGVGVAGVAAAFGANPFLEASGVGVGALTRVMLRTLRPQRQTGSASILASFEFRRDDQR